MTQSACTVKTPQRSKFVSCIRIDGVPILPPLITAEKRKEMNRHKRDAIKVEKRLRRERELKEYVSQLYLTCTNNFDELYDAHNLCSKESQTFPFKSNTQLVIENNINLHDIQSRMNQCFDLNEVDVTAKKLFTVGSDDCEALDHADQHAGNDELGCKQKDASHERDKSPKLIRCNSYTLEAPSPALVAYLRTSQSDLNPTSCWELDLSTLQPSQTPRSENKDDVDACSQFVNEPVTDTHVTNREVIEHELSETTFTKDVILDDLLDETQQTDNNHIMHQLVEEANICKLSGCDDCNNELNTSRAETELHNITDCENQLQDINVNKITNCSVVEYKSGATANETHSEPALSVNIWDNILKQIPSTYSRQILELLERKQPTHLDVNESSEISEAFAEIRHNREMYSTPCDTALTSHSSATVFSVCEQDTASNIRSIASEGTFYEDARADCSTKASLNEDEIAQKDSEQHLRLELATWRNEVITGEGDVGQQQVSKDLRRNKGAKILSRDAAAHILTAVARGFLVRRLMKTEKVQYLIQTIKDAVMCAMELHHDTLEHIEEADVELHRRLIQQVSAACYSFHNVFFATSTQDQMSFIAVDRQKKLDKQRRVLSAGSSSSLRSSKSNRSANRRLNRKRLLRS